MSNNKKDKNSYKPNFWGMMRDVLIASMNKGLFLPAMTGFLLMILVIKLPMEEVSILLHRLIDLFVSFKITGWVAAGGVTFAWYFNAKFLRRSHTNEMTRIGDEKKGLQEKVVNKKLPSSNTHKKP